MRSITVITPQMPSDGSDRAEQEYPATPEGMVGGFVDRVSVLPSAGPERALGSARHVGLRCACVWGGGGGGLGFRLVIRSFGDRAVFRHLFLFVKRLGPAVFVSLVNHLVGDTGAHPPMAVLSNAHSSAERVASFVSQIITSKKVETRSLAVGGSRPAL